MIFFNTSTIKNMSTIIYTREPGAQETTGTSNTAPASRLQGAGEKELSSHTLAGVNNMAKDLADALEAAAARLTEAALLALEECETDGQKQGVLLCYAAQLRSHAAAIVAQAENQFSAHMDGFAPFSECTKGLNRII